MTLTCFCGREVAGGGVSGNVIFFKRSIYMNVIFQNPVIKIILF